MHPKLTPDHLAEKVRGTPIGGLRRQVERRKEAHGQPDG
jgi:hypothetical protein